MTGEIPQSQALGEASPDSLQDLFTRPVADWGDPDMDRGIEALRRMRVKWEAAEAAGTTRKRGATKVAGEQELPAAAQTDLEGLL